MWNGILSLFGVRPSQVNTEDDYADGGTLSGQVERDQQNLTDVQRELATLEEELTRCNTAIRRAIVGERQIQEGWEQLVMETYDHLEFPILALEVETAQKPMFEVLDGAIEALRIPQRQWKKERREKRVAARNQQKTPQQRGVDDTHESDYSSMSSSDNNDVDPSDARAFNAAAVIDVPAKKSGDNGEEVGEEGTQLADIDLASVPYVLDLHMLRPENFVGGMPSFGQWLEYKRVWNAREALTERGCLKSLTGDVVTAREELEDKLFHLRLKMLHIRALEANANHDLERAGGETEHGDMLAAPVGGHHLIRSDDGVVQ